MLVRQAVADDVSSIVRIVDEAYGGYVERIGRPPAPMSVDYPQVVAQGRARVLVDDGAVLGVIVSVAESDHLFVENVAVSPSAQGRGCGRTLLADAEASARASGLTEIRLYTNATMTANLSMYPRLGFDEVDRRTEDGFDRVYFVRTLRAAG